LKKNLINRMLKIKKIEAKEVISGSGIPTIAGKLILDNDSEVVTTVPTNLNNFSYQSVELKDNDPLRYEGQGVTQAVSFINDLLGPKLVGVTPDKQFEIDGWLITSDSTKNKSKLGVNTIFIISSLIAKAGGLMNNQSLFTYLTGLYEKRLNIKVSNKKVPTPIYTLSPNNQEIYIISSTSNPIAQSLPVMVAVSLVFKNFFQVDSSSSIIDMIEGLISTCDEKQYHFGKDVFLGINFLGKLKADHFINVVNNLTKKYLPLMIFDPLFGDSFGDWHNLNNSLSKETYLVSDVLTSGNSERIQRAIKEKSCSSFIIKPSEIGTITETIDLTNLIRKNNLSYIISSGDAETEDSFVADLSVGLQSEFVRFGPTIHAENTSKYNRLMEIEKEINSKVKS